MVVTLWRRLFWKIDWLSAGLGELSDEVLGVGFQACFIFVKYLGERWNRELGKVCYRVEFRGVSDFDLKIW